MKTDVKNNRFVVTLLLGTVLVLTASARQISFPGSKSTTKSPDGRYTVQNLDDAHAEPAHALMLIDSKSGKQHKIYEYGRHVDVLWSPASDALVVNDYGGSDFSRAMLFTLPSGESRVNLWKELIHFLQSRGDARSALGNGHVYFTVEKWLNDHEFRCKLTGYGPANRKGFTEHYVYEIGVGFRASEVPAGF
jgi:hypothetical protein